MTKQEISNQLTKLHRKLSALRGQTVKAQKADHPIDELMARRGHLADQIAELERAYAA